MDEETSIAKKKHGKYDDGLPVYTEENQGISDDLREISPESAYQAATSAIYTGSRESLIQGLKSGNLANGLELVTPEVLRRRTELGRAAGYVRVSLAEQAKVGGGDEGYSIPYQRLEIQRKAEAMGLPITDWYVDPGFTGTTVRRPEFQRLLRDIEAGKITHVIVHKIDRLSRSPKADYAIDMALEKARGHIVSCCEPIDDTPAGKLNLQMLRGVAHYYSNNLATEVVKGISTKLDQGGTPGQAPLGYLNRRMIRDDGADIRWVEEDPVRGPLMTWAFTEYATGDWSLASLVDALEAKGLRTRGTPKRPSKPLGTTSLHRLLSNPYFVGVVAYKGIYHQGKHPTLTDMETWLRVQDVLKAHNIAGEKDRKHPHYLKGSIWCGHCGRRMVYSRNQGKLGGWYEYFFCMGKKDRSNRCPRPYVKLAAIEAGVVDFYTQLQISPERAEQIRTVVREELASTRDVAKQDIMNAVRSKQRVEYERKKLLEAHYAGAIPLDMMKSEMDRLTRELNQAEQTEAAAKLSLTDLDTQLKRALDIATHCARLYEAAKPAVRRMMNQGFFRRLYVSEDGSIEDAELNEPFVHLLARDEATVIEQRKARARRIFGEGAVGSVKTDAPDDAGTVLPHEEAFRAQADTSMADESEPERSAPGGDWATDVPDQGKRGDIVLLSFWKQARTARTRPKLVFGPGSNNSLLAEDRGFEPLRALTQPAFQASAIGH